MSTLRALPARIASKIRIEKNGCWNWTAALSNGYGILGVQGESRRAHRVVYLLLRGEIAEGLHLDHLCRNRRCCNPDHLEPVTNQENNRRSNSASAQHARQTHCVRGHEFTPENTYFRKRAHKTERFCRECCRIRDRQRVRSARRVA